MGGPIRNVPDLLEVLRHDHARRTALPGLFLRYLQLLCHTGSYDTDRLGTGFYGGIATIGWIYQLLFMPRTMNKTLEDRSPLPEANQGDCG